MTDRLLQRLTIAYEKSQMIGWDFSRLDGRFEAERPDWDFDSMCVEALRGIHSALDMGTGGGERLTTLCQRLDSQRPPHLRATEGWKPNLPVARAALEPLGIEVADYDSETDAEMPFRDASFGVVMSCHESYDVSEVCRVLLGGGLLLTQQVHTRNEEELRRWFHAESAYPDVTLGNYVAAAELAGLTIEGQGEWIGEMRFCDAEALVEYMAMVPWETPGFSVEPNLTMLAQLDARRPIILTQRRFWLAALK